MKNEVGGPAGLNTLVRFLLELVEKPAEEVKKLIRSPDLWNCHRTLLVGAFYNCHACMRRCPSGKENRQRAW